MQEEVLRKPGITPAKQKQPSTVWNVEISGSLETLKKVCSLAATEFNIRWTKDFSGLEIRSLKKEGLTEFIETITKKFSLQIGTIISTQERVQDVFF